MRALRPSTKSPRGSIVPGGVYAGHGIPPSVQTLVAVSVPLVSGPPGNPEGFQAHAGFPLRIKKPAGFFDALSARALRALLGIDTPDFTPFFSAWCWGPALPFWRCGSGSSCRRGWTQSRSSAAFACWEPCPVRYFFSPSAITSGYSLPR